MRKEKTVKAHTRKTKTGKTVQVKQHTAKYDAADMAREALKRKEGAGEEINKRKKVSKEVGNTTSVSQEDFKAWYNWDGESNDESALRAEKSMKKAMGTKKYKEFYNNVADNWTSRGANKHFKSFNDSIGTKEAVKPTLGGNNETYNSRTLSKAISKASEKYDRPLGSLFADSVLNEIPLETRKGWNAEKVTNYLNRRIKKEKGAYANLYTIEEVKSALGSSPEKVKTTKSSASDKGEKSEWKRSEGRKTRSTSKIRDKKNAETNKKIGEVKKKLKELEAKGTSSKSLYSLKKQLSELEGKLKR